MLKFPGIEQLLGGGGGINSLPSPLRQAFGQGGPSGSVTPPFSLPEVGNVGSPQQVLNQVERSVGLPSGSLQRGANHLMQNGLPSPKNLASQVSNSLPNPGELASTILNSGSPADALGDVVRNTAQSIGLPMPDTEGLSNVLGSNSLPGIGGGGLFSSVAGTNSLPRPDVQSILGSGSAGLSGNISIFDRMLAREDPHMLYEWLVLMPFNMQPEFVESVTIPIPSIDPEAVFRAGRRFYYPKFQDIGDVAATFYETHAFTVTNWIKEWKTLIMDENGLYGLPSDYARDIVLYAVDPTGTRRAELRIKRCFPTTGDVYPYSSGNSERLIPSHTFSADALEFEIL